MSSLLNPFSAASFEPGRVPWHAVEGPSIGELFDRVARGGRFQVLGPCGSGKTTLLAHLAAAALARGLRVERWRGNVQRETLEPAYGASETLVLVDEAEQQSLLTHLRLRLACTLRGKALVLAAHGELGAVTLVELDVDVSVLEHVLRCVLRDHEPALAVEELEARLERHAGNVREILFELYDEYERHVTATRCPSRGPSGSPARSSVDGRARRAAIP